MDMPYISNKKLERLVKTIKPVMKFSKKINSKETKFIEDSEGDLYFLKFKPRNDFTLNLEPSSLAKNINPEPYKTIRTLHYRKFRGYEYAKDIRERASVADVLAQIPEKDLQRCVAFEIAFKDNEICFTDNRGVIHFSETRLYEKK